jgi:hypothetical protein
MAALSAADFFKQASGNRPDRKVLVLSKYKSGSAFEMKDGTHVVFKFEKSTYDKIAGLLPGDNTGYNSITLKDNKNKTYKKTRTFRFGLFYIVMVRLL